VILSLIEQHAESAAFLWFRRDGAARAAHHSLLTLADIDARIEAHLDGLRVAGATGAEVARAALAEDDAGVLFVAAVLALGGGDLRGLARLLDLAAAEPARCRELIAALGWVPWETVAPLLPGFFHADCPPFLHLVGIAACAAHGRDPGPVLGHSLYAVDLALRARALRAVGELYRLPLARDVKIEIAAEDEDCRFWATWTSALLGDAQAVEALWPFASGDGPMAARALDLAMRRLDPKIAMGWLEVLQSRPASVRIACHGATALAEVAAVQWLLAAAREPALARLAAEGISAVTGLTIRGPLAGKAPEGFSAGPTSDSADSDVALDPDEHLPWPEPSALEARCRDAIASMARGVRHTEGKPTTPERLQLVLRQGTQPRRASAALELLLRTKAGPLFPVRAPAARQRSALAR
jgi:uncharacterized protein (TIGR02270 family)